MIEKGLTFSSCTIVKAGYRKFLLSTIPQSPSDLEISPSSPSEPKLLRSKSANYVCKYHLLSLVKHFSASPFAHQQTQCH